jgi:hypothetical protein
MNCLANRIQIIVLMLEDIQLYILFGILLDDSFWMMPLATLLTLHYLLLMGGELRKHLLILGLDRLLGL